MLGWNRPLRYFFMTIRKPAELIDSAMKVEDEDFLYSNLHEEDPFGHGLDYYRAVLGHFHIDVPSSMFTEVQKDYAGNVGNRVVKHERSEEHTSELQSLLRISYAVFCLKKKKKHQITK